MGKIKRYIHLYFSCLKRSLISRLEYKKDTIIAIFSFLISNVASILAIYFVISSIPSLDGWSFYQLGFLYGFSMLPVSIDHLFSDDLWNVAYSKVKQGELDRYFLRPVPVLFQVISETFQPEGFGELLVGIIMMCVCGANLSIDWSFSFVLLLVVATIFGGLIITSLKIICAALAFVFKRSGPLLQVVYDFISYTRYPLSIFPKFVKYILMFIFPFALVISLPIETLIFETWNPYILSLIIIGGSLSLLGISIIIWSICAKRYESTGS